MVRHPGGRVKALLQVQGAPVSNDRDMLTLGLFFLSVCAANLLLERNLLFPFHDEILMASEACAIRLSCSLASRGMYLQYCPWCLRYRVEVPYVHTSNFVVLHCMHGGDWTRIHPVHSYPLYINNKEEKTRKKNTPIVLCTESLQYSTWVIG